MNHNNLHAIEFHDEISFGFFFFQTVAWGRPRAALRFAQNKPQTTL